ncbi:hypothetical protein XMIN_2133 [Xanthomonas citri pv. mangiferaeindicae LMG 941]|nr:hypothetical protein XMIN_2133 [Xanthomonas citri pv. mangiferaeindicae LMG 941]
MRPGRTADPPAMPGRPDRSHVAHGRQPGVDGALDALCAGGTCRCQAPGHADLAVSAVARCA